MPTSFVKSTLDAMGVMVKVDPMVRVDPECNACTNATFSSGGEAHLRQHGRLVKHLKKSGFLKDTIMHD